MPENLMQEYRVTLPQGSDSFTLTYGGEIFLPPRQDAREARSFESTPGIIAAEGTVLTGDSGWYPGFGDGMLTFSLDIELPSGWRAISQGKRNTAKRVSDSAAQAGWQEDQPQDEIYLIAAPFTEYARNDAGIESLVYLRTGRCGARPALSGCHRALHRDVSAADRPLSLRQVRAGGKFLGNRIRHAVIHLAGQPGDPPAVHHRHILSARDPAQLVGQRRVRGLRRRQLVGRPHRLSGRSPVAGTKRQRCGIPAQHIAKICRFRFRRPGFSAHTIHFAPQRANRSGGLRQGHDDVPHAAQKTG